MGDLVPQDEATLLEAPKCQIIRLPRRIGAVDQVVEVGVLDAQLDQSTGGRMQVVFHGVGAGAPRHSNAGEFIFRRMSTLRILCGIAVRLIP